MRLFTVHLPTTAGSGRPAFERAEFVRDGFHVFAFLFGIVWCLWKGLWMAALALLALSVALFGMGRLLQLSGDAQIWLQLVLALLVGLEASNMRRSRLRGRGYADAGSVAAGNLNEAEAIFFGRVRGEMADGRRPAASGPAGAASRGGARGTEDVVGLFPEYHLR